MTMRLSEQKRIDGIESEYSEQADVDAGVTATSVGGAWHIPPHVTHDDPLLDCLVALTQWHGVATSAQALSAGLPLVDHRLTPSLLARAAARVRFTTRIV